MVCVIKWGKLPKQRKEGAQKTTISVSWSSKTTFRKLAKKTKTTKNGDVFESDTVIFDRILEDYLRKHPDEVSRSTTSTYPSKNP